MRHSGGPRSREARGRAGYGAVLHSRRCVSFAATGSLVEGRSGRYVEKGLKPEWTSVLAKNRNY